MFVGGWCVYWHYISDAVSRHYTYIVFCMKSLNGQQEDNSKGQEHRRDKLSVTHNENTEYLMQNVRAWMGSVSLKKLV